ncbi:uncharacterized protein LOC106157780 [Lingula anatina]|uniref:Chromatin-remodeling ATPase INO80 n=1 Tax=Lingula anatina TaxID=7574 RepID=A0A1S3HV94_LINAN|nr:uncharacterized protein LOC106157780 [Lingula anatina]|eukprot:XP_013388979.2 uncharacterized protein LOC106157780 [Lingula anatina]
MQEDSMVINAIVVHGIHQTTSDDTIELFFENKRKSGGGEIAKLERNPLTEDVTITFVDPEVADRVLERGLLKLEGATLTICRLTPPEPVRSVEIRGFHQNTSDDSLEMLFESKKRSGGGEIEDINIDRASGVAVITYKDHEVAARVIQHGESPGTILDGNRLHVEWPCEKSAPSAIGGTRSEDNQVETPKLDTIRVHGFHQESTTESLTLFFENRKRSGGGPVQNITMNEDKTEALITFPDPEVVNRILQKWEQTGLTLDKSSLDIAAVQPPPPVTYDLQKVCFKKVGVNVTTDLLENFIEAKTSYSVENITFGAIPGTVLVALSEPITDFDNFKANCSKKKLEGSNLVVERVPLTTSIQVHKLPQNITEDALENYFENEKKSGGGGVSVVHMASDSASAIVTFDNPEVVDRVLKKKHILNKTHVKVSIYHECLGILPPGHDPSKPYLPLPKPIQLENVEYGLVEFIKGIKRHRSAAEQAFADVSARIQWPQNPASMPSVTCALSQQSPNYREAAETWERNVREVMNKVFKEEFVYKEFSTLQAIWEKTNQALSLLPNPENDNYRLQTEDQTCVIRVMGEAGIANEVIQKITQIQKQLDEQMRRDALVVKEKKTLKLFQLRYLLAIQYKKIAKQMFPDMNISIDQDSRMLHLKGMPDDVNKAMIDVYERINALLHQTFKLPPASMLLMGTKECREHLVDLFRRESLDAVWVVGSDEVSVHATKQDEITHACQIIKQNIIETPVSIKDGSQGILNTEKWHATVDQQEKLYPGLCRIIPKADNSSVTIVAVKSVSGNVLECVSDFLTFNTVVEEFMKMERGKVTFLVERRLKRLREIEKENAENQVKIKWGKSGKSSGFLVQGNQPGIIATTRKLRDLCLKIESEIKEINKPGMPKYILSQRGKDFLENVETKHDCTIDVPSSSGPAEEDGDFVIVDSSDINQKVVAHIKTPDNCVVAIHRDDLTQQHVDVIVNAANRDMAHIGGLAKAIVDAGGQSIQDECSAYTGKHGALLDGQVFASSAGKLPCKKILHAVGPVWRGGNNNEENLLYEAVYNCLDEATKMKFKAISFPALSAGVYRFPIDKCSEVILEAIRDFFKNSSTSITEVRIVSLEERVLTAFQRALHGIFPTGSSRTDEGASYDGGYGRVSASVGAGEHSQFTGLETESCSSYLPTTDPLTMNTRERLLVSLRKAVLAQEMADIIVNTTSRDLKLANGAVSKSLLSAGGNVLQVECDQQAPNGLQFGDIVETSGGNLKCKRVFHGSCLNWSSSGSEECLRKLVKTCLFTADKGNYTSIAIPAIGTGNLGFPKDVVARAMYEEIANFSTSKPETTLREVRLVVYDKDHATVAAFEDEIRQLKRGRGRKPRRRGKESNEDISSERSGHSTSRRKANGFNEFSFSDVFIQVVPYWGNTQDRKILRSFWDQAHAYTEQSSFHVVITSYQLVIQDMKYFQKIKWIYMVLDEAQAIKSSSSIRWKMLLGFSCRNRLLLTGTPIQNSMAELWALLHFIMPTLFDSHDEFNEWFSKDIEGSVEKMSGMDENCLSRLHMILKPFMLRRVKKDVENELSDKIEILVYCHLTRRQKILYQAIKNKIRIEDLIQSAMATSASQAQSTTSSLMNLVMQFRKVCNHPELFERREVRSPFHYKPETFILPKRIYRECLIDHALPSKQRLLYNMFCIYNPENVHRSLVGTSDGLVKSGFSFLRFIDVSPQELASVMLGGLLVRWLALFLWLKSANRIYHQQQWHSDEPKVKYLSNKAFLLEPLQTVYFPSVQTSQHIKEMVFTGYNNTAHGFLEHTLHYIPETPTHRRTRLRHLHFHGHAGRQLGSPTSRTPRSPPVSPTKTLPTSPTKRHHSHIDLDSAIHRHLPRPPKVLPCQLTDVPAFLYNAMPKIACCPREIYCCDRSAAWEHMRASLCGSLDARNSLLYGTPDVYEQVRWAKYYFYPTLPCGMYGITPKHGYSGIFVPDKETLVTDAGKLSVLDTLLQRLKSEGHRVLIYSQMTRMIDLLEEYMWHRKHTYMRLDGSSKISDRRDMVADFQTRSDIFVFLLSTRAGGLGINLTAADTVIFYDSDWNPTVDQQAMDRAHRLGQTKQVTVYRLICKGSIEERILERAKEKSEIHRMVISGGSFRPDTLKPKEVVSLLLDDSEMTRKLKQKQEEKSLKQEKYKVKDRNRKREQYAKKKQEKGETVRKRKKDNSASAAEESNFTIPADSESMYSCDSPSIPPSPGSVVSVGSEQPLTIDESSNDGGLLIVDDAHSTFPPVTTQVTSTPKRGSGRRGRPRGSGMGRRPRGRGSITKALTAAEIAGAKAGKSAAFKAYGYSFTGTEETSNQSQTDSQGL